MATISIAHAIASFSLADLLTSEDHLHQTWDAVQWARDVKRLGVTCVTAVNVDVLPYVENVDAFADTDAPPTVRVSFSPQGCTAPPNTEKQVTVAA